MSAYLELMPEPNFLPLLDWPNEFNLSTLLAAPANPRRAHSWDALNEAAAAQGASLVCFGSGALLYQVRVRQ
jgi:hypothetical protein